MPSVDAFSAKRYYGASAYGGSSPSTSANKKLAPVIKQVFLLYSPATAVPSVDAFSSKRYYGASAYGGYKSLASANKYMAPVNKQVFFFLSPQHCAIGKARFLADPLCGSQIQSALPLCRKAGFSAVKGILRNAITAWAPTGVTSPWQAPINIWHLLTNRCFYFIFCIPHVEGGRGAVLG